MQNTTDSCVCLCCLVGSLLPYPSFPPAEIVFDVWMTMLLIAMSYDWDLYLLYSPNSQKLLTAAVSKTHCSVALRNFCQSWPLSFNRRTRGHVCEVPVKRWISVICPMWKESCNWLNISSPGAPLYAVRLPPGHPCKKLLQMKNVVFWDIRTQLVPHRKHITSPLQRSAD
jgi:hypothetical protein